MVSARARLLAAAGLLAACGRGDAGGRAERGAAPEPAARPAVAKPACPRTGHWSECQVFDRLDQAGVAPRADSAPPALPAVGVAPRVYLVGRNVLAVYLFPDTLARARAARTLDTLHFIAPSAPLTMRGEATVIQNDNLLALLFSRIDLQRERVSDALMAGAPQP